MGSTRRIYYRAIEKITILILYRAKFDIEMITVHLFYRAMLGGPPMPPFGRELDSPEEVENYEVIISFLQKRLPPYVVAGAVVLGARTCSFHLVK